MTFDLLERIKKNKRTENGKNEEIVYGTCEMQGWRNEMEDAFCAVLDSETGCCFFGIFDGHGGNYCSNEASRQLWMLIKTNLLTNGEANATMNPRANKIDGKDENKIIKAIKESFRELDNQLKRNVEKDGNDDKSGTTVVAALVTSTKIYLVNCGDSRGLLVRNRSTIEIATFDHKPTQLKEKQRIQNAGGLIALNRVNGGLATSRGLGDFEYKEVPGLEPNQQFVSSEPDFYIIDRHPDDNFLVLACDGIWDVKKNEQVADFVADKLGDEKNLITPEKLSEISCSLVDSCFDSGSKDNMSVITICFKKNR